MHQLAVSYYIPDLVFDLEFIMEKQMARFIDFELVKGERVTLNVDHVIGFESQSPDTSVKVFLDVEIPRTLEVKGSYQDVQRAIGI